MTFRNLVPALLIVSFLGFGCHLRSEYIDQESEAQTKKEEVAKAPASTTPPSDFYKNN